MDTSQNNEPHNPENEGNTNPQNEGNTNPKTEDKPTFGLGILSFLNPQNEGNTNPNTEDKPTIGLSILSFIIPIVGFILAAVNWKSKPISAKRYLIISSISVSIFLFLDAVSSFNSSSVTNNSTVNSYEKSPRGRCESKCKARYNTYSDTWNKCMYACKDMKSN